MGKFAEKLAGKKIAVIGGSSGFVQSPSNLPLLFILFVLHLNTPG